MWRMENILLEIRDLSVTFRQPMPFQALKNINLKLYQGQLLALVGESGSGKTTLSRSILRLFENRPDVEVTGHIFYEGREIYPGLNMNLKSLRGQKIGMIFQEPLLALNPVFRVGNQICETMRYHLSMSKKEAKNSILELFQQLGLESPEKIYRFYPHQLSGGMRQRIMIAMVIACRPQLVIADEPTSALDANLKNAILSRLVNLCQHNEMTMIFITHDIHLAQKYAQHIVVLQKGEIIEEGTAHKVATDPQHPYTKRLMYHSRSNALQEMSFLQDMMIVTTM